MTAENDIFDIGIIGAGPAGLAAACAAQDAGLSYVVIERGGLVQSLVEHPQQIQYFSPADEMAIGGVPFFMRGGHKPTREDALAYYRAVASSRALRLCTWEEVTEARREPDGRFAIRAEHRVAGEGAPPIERRCRFLIVCAGTFPTPRRLEGVPGAGLTKVLYRLDDPTPFFGRDILVVGGGNSAATAAMTLAEAGARVTLATRRMPAPFQSHLRPFIVRDLTIMAEEKRLTLLTHVEVERITPTTVQLSPCPLYPTEDEQVPPARCELPNDFVFALLGHHADPRLFAALGLPLADDGLPVYDESTAETPIPGAFVAGSLSRANIILESRQRAVQIVALIAARLAPVSCPPAVPI